MADPPDLEIVRRLAEWAWRHGVEIDVTTNAERRAVVLRHPDVARRLCERPLSLPKPEQWNGYISPPTLATGGRNDSPVRAQVMEVYTEACRREQEGHQ